jgi:hypothetical protein
MRTTLDIDDDVLAALKERAGAQGTTASRLASDLLRRGLSSQAAAYALPGFAEEQAAFDTGAAAQPWVVLKSRGGLVTTELVRSLEDAMDAEDTELARTPRRQHPDRVDR